LNADDHKHLSFIHCHSCFFVEKKHQNNRDSHKCPKICNSRHNARLSLHIIRWKLHFWIISHHTVGT